MDRVGLQSIFKNLPVILSVGFSFTRLGLICIRYLKKTDAGFFGFSGIPNFSSTDCFSPQDGWTDIDGYLFNKFYNRTEHLTQ